jgi:hypothetical protein
MHCLSARMVCMQVCAMGLVGFAARAVWAQAAPAPAAAPSSASQPAPAVQTPPAGGDADPIAIVPIGADDPAGAATVTGALEVTGGKAKIAAGGSITSGARTAEVVLPHRGVLRVCASTTVKLAADTSVPTFERPGGEMPGLLMALDRGAVEMSFATTRAAGNNADVVLTPDFRILIAGPGSADLKVRLGEGGDTCVDNSGINAPYVVVTSLFDPGLYRVQPGQRVMFQHGSLSEVVDEEKEPCGCPPAPAPAAGNEFPLAVSEGLAPTPAPAPAPKQPASGTGANTAPLVYSPNAPTATATPPATQAAAPAQANPSTPPAKEKKPGFFTRIGHFFKKIFGAE